MSQQDVLRIESRWLEDRKSFLHIYCKSPEFKELDDDEKDLICDEVVVTDHLLTVINLRLRRMAK